MAKSAPLPSIPVESIYGIYESLYRTGWFQSLVAGGFVASLIEMAAPGAFNLPLIPDSVEPSVLALCVPAALWVCVAVSRRRWRDDEFAVRLYCASQREPEFDDYDSVIRQLDSNRVEARGKSWPLIYFLWCAGSFVSDWQPKERFKGWLLDAFNPQDVGESGECQYVSEDIFRQMRLEDIIETKHENHLDRENEPPIQPNTLVLYVRLSAGKGRSLYRFIERNQDRLSTAGFLRVRPVRPEAPPRVQEETVG